MLIKALDAKNFRKYNRLSVKDLPESGVISIEGSNESGKTSIGEAICFALFGRTFFLGQENLGKLVCWGSDVAEVTLTFKSGEGGIYTLWRSVDRSGESHVKLNKFDDQIDIKDSANAIDSSDKVELALSKLLGFDYDAFANSFYLAQRELTSPDPQSHTIKQMAGIGAYAQITDDFEESNKKNEQTIEELKPQVESTQASLDEINLDETWLPELIEAEETLGVEQQDRESLVSHLNDNEGVYNSSFNAYHGARKTLSFFGIVGKILFPIALILSVLSVLNSYFQNSLNEMLPKYLNESQLSSFVMFAEKWLLPATIISLIAWVLTLLARKSSKNKMRDLDEQSKDFSESLETGHGYVTTLVETLLPERVVQLLHEKDSEQSTLQILPPREQFNNLVQLIDDTPGYKADPEEVSSAMVRLSDALKKQDAEVGELSRSVLDDIGKEKERADKAGNLRASLQRFAKVMDKCNYNIDTHNVAIGLMQRAAKDSVDRFNKNISSVSENTLPSFTEGRYSKMKIAEDFSVKIYSDEKNDFMDFDEISSGTQRQVMLALRMAMSEQLSINSGNDQQFIFLDEPFAFFDQLRTKSTITALPDVSKVINQIWISAQEFPEDIKVEKVIECPLDETELFV